MIVLTASTTYASVSKLSVVIDDPLSSTPSSTPEISDAYSNIQPTVDEKDILVWHARLCHLTLPAINRLPYAVRCI